MITVNACNYTIITAHQQKHLKNVFRINEAGCKDCFGSASLPSALAKKYPNVGKTWVWQWVISQHVYSRITRLVSRGGIILILRLFSEPYMKLFYDQVFPNQSSATCSATHLQRIYWNPVTIASLSKSFLVIAMVQSLWRTPCL